MHRDSRRLVAFAGASALLVLLISVLAPAQNRIIKGKVTNEKGEPIVGAAVLIQGTDVKREYTVKTDKKGEYFYMGIPYGVYRVVVRAQGYRPDFAENVRPNINQESEIPFTLKPGADHKLAFELSPQELEKLKQEASKAEKQKEAAGEVKTLFDAGLQLAQQGKYAEAVAEFKKALEKDPERRHRSASELLEAPFALGSPTHTRVAGSNGRFLLISRGYSSFIGSVAKLKAIRFDWPASAGAPSTMS